MDTRVLFVGIEAGWRNVIVISRCGRANLLKLAEKLLHQHERTVPLCSRDDGILPRSKLLRAGLKSKRRDSNCIGSEKNGETFGEHNFAPLYRV
jgi:hypothetical protein